MATYGQLFAVREFRFLHGAQVLSYLGDQLAAVAVAVVVFDRTGSGLLTAVAYASAWLPGIVAGPLLSPYADRWSRRDVMVAADVARAALMLLLVVPGVPLAAMIGVLYVTHALSAPFAAARSALMPEVLDGDTYVTGNGLENIAFQLGQLAGLAGGGLVVALIGARGALAADAASYALSALLIVTGVRRRPAPDQPTRPGLAGGLRHLLADPWLRRCLALVWVAAAVTYAPEAIAYPWAGDPATAGLLMAAPCVGYLLGAFALTRLLSPATRDRLLVPLAVLGPAALIPAVRAPVPVMLALLALSGAGASFAAPLNAIFARRVDPAFRGRVMGVAISGLLAAQGLGFLTAGALVQAGLSPATVVTLCGCVGCCLVAIAAARWTALTTAPTR